MVVLCIRHLDVREYTNMQHLRYCPFMPDVSLSTALNYRVPGCLNQALSLETVVSCGFMWLYANRKSGFTDS